jgi:hypothetical protein
MQPQQIINAPIILRRNQKRGVPKLDRVYKNSGDETSESITPIPDEEPDAKIIKVSKKKRDEVKARTSITPNLIKNDSLDESFKTNAKRINE